MSGVDLVLTIVEIFSVHDLESQILAASVRNAQQVREMAQAGFLGELSDGAGTYVLLRAPGQLTVKEAQEAQAERRDVAAQSFPVDQPALLTRADPASVTLSVTTQHWAKSFSVQGESATIGPVLHESIERLNSDQRN